MNGRSKTHSISLVKKRTNSFPSSSRRMHSAVHRAGSEDGYITHRKYTDSDIRRSNTHLQFSSKLSTIACVKGIGERFVYIVVGIFIYVNKLVLNTQIHLQCLEINVYIHEYFNQS